MRQRTKKLIPEVLIGDRVRGTIRQQYRREGGKPLEEVRRELGLERKPKKPSRRVWR